MESYLKVIKGYPVGMLHNCRMYPKLMMSI